MASNKQLNERELREAEIQMTGRPPAATVAFIGFVPAPPPAAPRAQAGPRRQPSRHRSGRAGAEDAEAAGSPGAYEGRGSLHEFPRPSWWSGGIGGRDTGAQAGQSPGTRPPWNRTGGSRGGKRYATPAPALLDRLAARGESLFAARRTLRSIAGDYQLRLFEATIHASRMRAMMEAHGIEA